LRRDHDARLRRPFAGRTRLIYGNNHPHERGRRAQATAILDHRPSSPQRAHDIVDPLPFEFLPPQRRTVVLARQFLHGNRSEVRIVGRPCSCSSAQSKRREPTRYPRCYAPPIASPEPTHVLVSTCAGAPDPLRASRRFGSGHGFSAGPSGPMQRYATLPNTMGELSVEDKT
jgi:hypothetical protein